VRTSSRRYDVARIGPRESGRLVAAISVTLITTKTKKTREAPLKFLITAAGFFLATLFSIPAPAQTRALVTEEMMVKTADPGIEIYVRNKRPADMTSFRPKQTVL